MFSMILLSVAMAFAGPYRASSNIEGDVNADGEVNIADINVLIGHIMKSTYDVKGDMNHDGEINIADINFVIDIILNGPVTPSSTRVSTWASLVTTRRSSPRNSPTLTRQPWQASTPLSMV